MKKLIAVCWLAGASAGCFGPYWYPMVPSNSYAVPVPGAVAPRPDVAAPVPPAVSPDLASHEAALRELAARRDAAQKALNEYASLLEQQRRSFVRVAPAPAAMIAAAPAPAAMSAAAPATARQRPLTSFGISCGLRALETPFPETEGLVTFGLTLSHRLAGTSLALDLAAADAGFILEGETTDRVFSGIETSIGLRLMSTPAAPANAWCRPPVYYVGGGVVNLQVYDEIQDPFTAETVSEDTASSGGTYACIGVAYQSLDCASTEFELRQTMGTQFTTFGQPKSSDGLELLLRFSLCF